VETYKTLDCYYFMDIQKPSDISYIGENGLGKGGLYKNREYDTEAPDSREVQHTEKENQQYPSSRD
jgi:hypothetical protein